MEDNNLYADYENENGTLMFVVTPEGNYFTFPTATEDSEVSIIIDPKSHKRYYVHFNI
jgi:hypothetical protein